MKVRFWKAPIRANTMVMGVVLPEPALDFLTSQAAGRGVFLFPQNLHIGTAIEQILPISLFSEDWESNNRPVWLAP